MPTNLEWLWENDRERIIKNITMEDDQCDICPLDELDCNVGSCSEYLRSWLTKNPCEHYEPKDSREKLEEDWTEFYTTHERECLYQSDVGQFVFDLLDRQDRITHLEALEACDSCAYRVKHDELKGELTDLRWEKSDLECEAANYRRANERLGDLRSVLMDKNGELEAMAGKLEAERTYWKSQVRSCLDDACRHGGKPVYSEHVMDYPPTEGYAAPATLVTSEVDHLRDFYADKCRENDKLRSEVCDYLMQIELMKCHMADMEKEMRGKQEDGS